VTSFEDRTIRRFGILAFFLVAGCGLRPSFERRAARTVLARTTSGPADRQNARLHLAEFRRAELVLTSIGESRDQLAHFGDAVAGLGVRLKVFQRRAGFLFFFRRHFFEEGDRRVGVVPRSPHILPPEPVGLFLGAARELQEGQRNGQPQALPDGVTAYPAKEDQWDRKVVE